MLEACWVLVNKRRLKLKLEVISSRELLWGFEKKRRSGRIRIDVSTLMQFEKKIDVALTESGVVGSGV